MTPFADRHPACTSECTAGSTVDNAIGAAG